MEPELSSEVAKYLVVSGLTLINSPHILSDESRFRGNN